MRYVLCSLVLQQFFNFFNKPVRQTRKQTPATTVTYMYIVMSHELQES